MSHYAPCSDEVTNPYASANGENTNRKSVSRKTLSSAQTASESHSMLVCDRPSRRESFCIQRRRILSTGRSSGEPLCRSLSSSACTKHCGVDRTETLGGVGCLHSLPESRGRRQENRCNCVDVSPLGAEVQLRSDQTKRLKEHEKEDSSLKRLRRCE